MQCLVRNVVMTALLLMAALPAFAQDDVPVIQEEECVIFKLDAGEVPEVLLDDDNGDVFKWIDGDVVIEIKQIQPLASPPEDVESQHFEMDNDGNFTFEGEVGSIEFKSLNEENCVIKDITAEAGESDFHFKFFRFSTEDDGE